jgi:hypothetical protein
VVALSGLCQIRGLDKLRRPPARERRLLAPFTDTFDLAIERRRQGRSSSQQDWSLRSYSPPPARFFSARAPGLLMMVKSTITGISKKRRGRHTLYEGGKGVPQIGPPPELADAWIAKQPKPRPSRPATIRRLVEIVLKVKRNDLAPYCS